MKYLLFIAIFSLLLLGLATNQSLWLDEATSVLTARNLSAGQIVTAFSPSDFHPPLHYLLLHFWEKIGNSSEIWTRFFSLLSTFATAVFVFEIGKMLMPKKWALFAATLFSTCPLVFYYSHEARMYPLATTLTTLSFLGFLKWKKEFQNKWWLVWLVASTALIYTDYMPFLVLPVFLVPLIANPDQTLKKGIVAWLLSLTILYSPWLPTVFHQLSLGSAVQDSSPGWSVVLGSFSLKSAPLLWVKLMIGRVSFDNKLLYGGVVLLASLFFLIFLAKSDKRGFFLGWFILPVALGVLISLRLSIFQYFRFLYIAPAFYLLVASGARRTGKKAAISLVVFNLFFIGYYLQNPRFYREDWRSTATYINQNLKTPAVALFPNTAQSDPYRYYKEPAKVAELGSWAPGSSVQVWLFRYVQEIFDPEDSLRLKLESNGYRKIEEKSFNQILVWRYEKI